jgi:hypothetical protein
MATIIDADGHLLGPRSIWEEYTESAYRERVIQIAKDREGIDCSKINGNLRRDSNMAIAAACTPGEHFCEQCFISMDPDETNVSPIADVGLEECVIWGSDYPHFDCIFPAVVDQVKEACAKLPALVQQKIIGENANRLYNL